MRISIDKIISLLFFVLSVFYLYQTYQIQVFSFDEHAPFNAKTFPTFLAYFGMFLSVLFLVLPEKNPTKIDHKVLDYKSVSFLIFITVVYGFVILKAGFFLSTSLFLFFFILFFRREKMEMDVFTVFSICGSLHVFITRVIRYLSKRSISQNVRNYRMIEGILIGLQTALSLKNILMVMMGCFFGTIIGMLPGLGPMTAIALMIPITYGFEPATGLILMAGVYYGAVFGGSTSSILINAPGVPGTVATAVDGYTMAQKGKAG